MKTILLLAIVLQLAILKTSRREHTRRHRARHHKRKGYGSSHLHNKRKRNHKQEQEDIHKTIKIKNCILQYLNPKEGVEGIEPNTCIYAYLREGPEECNMIQNPFKESSFFHIDGQPDVKDVVAVIYDPDDPNNYLKKFKESEDTKVINALKISNCKDGVAGETNLDEITVVPAQDLQGFQNGSLMTEINQMIAKGQKSKKRYRKRKNHH